MVRAAALILAALLVAGCQGQDGFDQAKARYDFLTRNGASKGELCQQSRRVAALAADEGKSQDYQLWHSIAVLDCNAI